MFRRSSRTRILTDEASLSDALIAFFDAQPRSFGMELYVSWRGHTRKQYMRVAWAPVNELGLVAYLDAPICPVREDALNVIIPQVSKLLVGALVIEGDELVLRSTLPIEGVDFAQVRTRIEQIATNADALAKSVEP